MIRNDWIFLGIFAMNEAFPFPQLYLFSSQDKFLPPHFMEIVLNRQMAQFPVEEEESMVRFKDFETSEHVNHFEKFPDLYESEILSFSNFVSSQ